MIKVHFSYNGDIITGFHISGHAGFDDAGRDIICSATSMLAINTVNSIEKFSDDEFKSDMNEKTGMLKLNMTTTSDSSQLLLKSFKLGIETIQMTYGSEYVNILN